MRHSAALPHSSKHAAGADDAAALPKNELPTVVCVAPDQQTQCTVPRCGRRLSSGAPQL